MPVGLRCCPTDSPRLGHSASPESCCRGEHNRASRDALLCSLVGCIAPHSHVSVLPGGGSKLSITIALRRPHDAVGTRLAVCVRLCSCARIQSKGICVGVPPAQFRLPARLPRGLSPNGKQTSRNISRSLGTALSLSTRSCRQTTLRWSGCRSLIPPRFSSSRQPSPFRVRAHFAL